ncbi:hypothetical protein TWF696_002619 [Orbilia brochopaga]|uniref:Uncharacterized protein n=1 Tax=Orbilia brochopaga TaxID=3140254 RepID=A0AAV9U560_9PEZI
MSSEDNLPLPVPLIGPPPRDAAQQAEWDRIGKERLEEDTQRLKQYIEAMQADTARHKVNWELQKVLLTAAIAYAGENDVWKTCECQFCIHFRHFNEVNGAEVVRGHFWNDPVYMANCQPLDDASLKKCFCSFCQNLTRNEFGMQKENMAGHSMADYSMAGHGTVTTAKEPVYYPDSLALDARATEPGFSPPPRTPPAQINQIYNPYSDPGDYNYANAGTSAAWYPGGNANEQNSYGYNNAGTYDYNNAYGANNYANNAGYGYNGTYTQEYNQAIQGAPIVDYHGIYGNAPTANNTTGYPAYNSGYIQDPSTGSSSDFYYGNNGSSALAEHQNRDWIDDSAPLPPGLPVPNHRQRHKNKRAYNRHNGGRGGHRQGGQGGHGHGNNGEGQSSNEQGGNNQGGKLQERYNVNTGRNTGQRNERPFRHFPTDSSAFRF